MATITRTSDRERERLRRAAASVDQGPKPEEQAGAYPRQRQLELLGDPQDPTNVSFPFLRRIRRNHMAAMGLHFIALPILKAPWYYEADDARVQTFAEKLIRPIYGSTVLTILRMLWAGYSPAAKNFEALNPTWTYYQDGVEKKVWDTPGVDAMVYKPVTELRPENSLPLWKDGKFNGITYDARYGGIGYFNINGQRKPDIDLLHSVWAVHGQQGEDGSPFGYPRIAHCAPIFHMYSFIWTLLGRAFENNADPGPVVRYPRDEMGAVDSDGNPINNVDTALRIGSRRRSGSTIALPSEPYTDFQDKPTGKYKWDIEYPKSETNFTQVQAFLDYLDDAMLRAIWIQEQGLVSGSGGQSNRNVASEFGEKRDSSQVMLMMQIAEIFDEVFVRPALAINMPWYEGSVKMCTIGFDSDEDEVVRQILQLRGQQEKGGSFGVNMRRILEAKGMPMLSHAEYKHEQEEAAKAAERAQPPAITPTQGRRALVTQTGFDESTGEPVMSYVQLGGTIHLSDDVDFLASLPRTDTFSDRQVLATTRDIRSTSNGFISWLYGDFARFIGKQRIDFEQPLEDQELMALGQDAGKLADKIINRWRPKSDKITDFATKTRSALGRAFDRTAGLHLQRLRSESKLSSTDKLAAQWLDAQGAEMVTSVLDTTRQQIATVLADGIKAKKTSRQIAADIREHFEGFSEARASMIARTEISAAYNYATVRAGMVAGVKRAQLLDGNSDACKRRNGKIVTLEAALKEKLDHPNCQLLVRLLPLATNAFEVRHEHLDGFMACYDQDTQTVLLSPEISPEEEASYLLALGQKLAAEDLAQEPVLA